MILIPQVPIRALALEAWFLEASIEGPPVLPRRWLPTARLVVLSSAGIAIPGRPRYVAVLPRPLLPAPDAAKTPAVDATIANTGVVANPRLVVVVWGRLNPVTLETARICWQVHRSWVSQMQGPLHS